MSEIECRYEDCARFFGSKEARNSHEGLAHPDRKNPRKPPDKKLRELYEKHASMSIISNKYGVSRTTVSNWIKNSDIESNSRGYYWKRKPPNVFTDGKGYERVIVNEGGSNSSFRIHQLLAIAQGYDADEVFSPTTEVHHKSGVEWDNRMGNVEVLEKSEHRKLHILRSPRSSLARD